MGSASRHLLSEIRLSWNGEHYQRILDEAFKAYVVTDQFCLLDEEDRVDQVFYFQQIVDIISKIDSELRKT